MGKIADAGDLNKVDGDIFYAADVTAILSSIGTNSAQQSYEQVKIGGTNWGNLDYLGADNFTDINGVKNTVDTTNSTAVYNSGYYNLDTTDFSGINEYIIIEALTVPTISINNCLIKEIKNHKWIIYCTVGSDAVQRAQIIKTLFYGTDGTDAEINNFNSITSIKTSHSNDVGKGVYYIRATAGAFTGTFSDTTNNTNCSSWSYCYALVETSLVISDETGMDKTGDEQDNPVNCKILNDQSTTNSDSYWYMDALNLLNQAGAVGLLSPYEAKTRVIILCEGTISWDTAPATNTYFMDTLPFFTQADTISIERGTDGTVKTNTIINDKVPKSILVYGRDAIPTNTDIKVDVSDDGGATFPITNKALNFPINTSTFTGTDLSLKFNLSTTDPTITPKLYGYGVSIIDE